MIVSPEKLSDAQPHLHGIDSGIRSRQSCIRDVHVSQFQADVSLRAEDVHAERRLVHEVYGVRSGGNVMVGEEHAAGEFEVGRDASVTLEVPLEAQRVEAYAVGRVRRLEYQEYRNRVDRILKASAEKARQVWPGKNPSITQAGVEDSSVAASAADGVAAARPDLNFVAAFFRTGLGKGKGRRHQDQDEE